MLRTVCMCSQCLMPDNLVWRDRRQSDSNGRHARILLPGAHVCVGLRHSYQAKSSNMTIGILPQDRSAGSAHVWFHASVGIRILQTGHEHSCGIHEHLLIGHVLQHPCRLHHFECAYSRCRRGLRQSAPERKASGSGRGALI